jgi:hypothetical protein
LCGKSTAGRCAPTWAAVLADKINCSEPEEERVYTCGNYQVRYLDDLDEHTLSFYDSKTGNLTAVMLYSMAPPECVAGYAPFTPPAECIDGGTPVSKPCPDGGVDGAPLGPF